MGNSPQERRSMKVRGKTTVTAIFFLIPFLIFFAVFRFIPLVLGAFMSFHDYPLLGKIQFLGLKNYLEIFTDEIFLKALRNNFVYMGGIAPLLVLALFCSILVKRVGRGKNLYKAIIFLPYIIPLVIHGAVFKFILEPGGPFGRSLGLLGFKSLVSLEWLGNSSTAKWTIMFIWVYVYVGYMMSIIYVSLQEIPDTYYEAADIDGAGAFEKLVFITLPLLRNIMLYVVVTGIIFALQILPLVWVTTGVGFGLGAGGPAYSTISLDLYEYQTAFRDLKLGYASSMGYIMMIITLFISLIPFRFLSEVKYD